MKSKLALSLSLAILLLPALFLALPSQRVSAETCRDARGQVIPCPERKRRPTETPQRPTKTPTATPTATPTKTILAFSPPLILTSAALTSVALTSQAPHVDSPPIGGMPTWLLAGGLLGALVLALLIGVIRRGANPGPHMKDAPHTGQPGSPGGAGGTPTNGGGGGSGHSANMGPTPQTSNPPEGDSTDRNNDIEFYTGHSNLGGNVLGGLNEGPGGESLDPSPHRRTSPDP